MFLLKLCYNWRMKVKHSLILFGIALGGLMIREGASALDWQDEVNVQFTFNSALTVTLSREQLLINELSPDGADNSNEIDITVTTNNVSGYKLFATVGDAQHNYRTLLHTNGTNNFASLDVGSSVSSFPAGSNTWGYSTDSGSTYSGLPLYSDTTNSAMLNSSAVATTQVTPFLIGARATAEQVSGSYTNVINFTAVTNVNPERIKLQDLATPSVATTYCTTATPTTVYDVRDGLEYKIQKLADGNCWMLDNLRLDLTAVSLASLKGNTNASDDTLTYLKNGSGTGQYPASGVVAKTATGGSWADSMVLPYIATSGTDNSGWNKEMTTTSYGSGSGKIGVYYNYCAATAGSYCYADNASTDDAEEDICPTGWRLPTGGSTGEYQALYTAYSSDATNFRTAFSASLAGDFYTAVASGQGTDGYFWTSTYDESNDDFYVLSVNASTVNTAADYSRDYGNSIRCVLK